MDRNSNNNNHHHRGTGSSGRGRGRNGHSCGGGRGAGSGWGGQTQFGGRHWANRSRGRMRQNGGSYRPQQQSGGPMGQVGGSYMPQQQQTGVQMGRGVGPLKVEPVEVNGSGGFGRGRGGEAWVVEWRRPRQRQNGGRGAGPTRVEAVEVNRSGGHGSGRDSHGLHTQATTQSQPRALPDLFDGRPSCINLRLGRRNKRRRMASGMNERDWARIEWDRMSGSGLQDAVRDGRQNGRCMADVMRDGRNGGGRRMGWVGTSNNGEGFLPY